jgi:DNA (cytosine-5)-methyltransferase 1
MTRVLTPLITPLKVVDLFSGCGGMSAGFRAHADCFEIIGAVDLEVAKPSSNRRKTFSTKCNATYYRNIGLKPKNADIRTLNPKDYRIELGLKQSELDVLIACPPCTGLSQKNSKNHLQGDSRNSLIDRVADFVEEFLPDFLVMENVKEILKGRNTHHFEYLKKCLRGLGYSLHAELHQFSDYGLPQRRKRALIIARRCQGLISPKVLEKSKKCTVWDAIGDMPRIDAGETDSSDPMHVSPGMTTKVLLRIQSIPKNGGSWGDIMANPDIPQEQKQKLLIPSMFRARPGSFPDVYGRLKWHDVAATITRECGHVGNGRYTHPEQDRLLTVREMSLLQGFPKNYYFEGSLSSKYNQIGDAVPPYISKKIAQHIVSLKLGQVPSQDASCKTVAKQLSLIRG